MQLRLRRCLSLDSPQPALYLYRFQVLRHSTPPPEQHWRVGLLEPKASEEQSGIISTTFCYLLVLLSTGSNFVKHSPSSSYRSVHLDFSREDSSLFLCVLAAGRSEPLRTVLLETTYYRTVSELKVPDISTDVRTEVTYVVLTGGASLSCSADCFFVDPSFLLQLFATGAIMTCTNSKLLYGTHVSGWVRAQLLVRNCQGSDIGSRAGSSPIWIRKVRCEACDCCGP